MEFPMIACHPWSLERHAKIGIGFAETKTMKFFCKHCDEIVVGKPYRVISEEAGVILLDMTVCRPCYQQARALGLYSEAIPLGREPRRRRHPLAFAHPITADR